MAVLTEIFHDFPWVSSLLNVHTISWNWQRTQPSIPLPLHLSWSSFPFILCYSSSSVEVVLPSTPCYLFLFPQAIFFSLCLFSLILTGYQACTMNSWPLACRMTWAWPPFAIIHAPSYSTLCESCHSQRFFRYNIAFSMLSWIAQVQYCSLILELDGSCIILLSQPWIGWWLARIHYRIASQLW